jgi:hypothetical protein
MPDTFSPPSDPALGIVTHHDTHADQQFFLVDHPERRFCVREGNYWRSLGGAAPRTRDLFADTAAAWPECARARHRGRGGIGLVAGGLSRDAAGRAAEMGPQDPQQDRGKAAAAITITIAKVGPGGSGGF